MRLLPISVLSALFLASTLTAPAPAVAAIAEPPEAASDTTTEPALDPAPPPAARKKRCADGKRCRKRAPKLDPRLAESAAYRAQMLQIAEPMVTDGRLAEAARILGDAAESRADPVLYLAAAEADLADPRADASRLTRARALTETAQRLILHPVELRITPEDGARLVEEAQALARFAGKREAQLKQGRRARAEVATGAVFLALGASGLGILAAGAGLAARVETARDEYSGQDAPYLAALDATDRRADTLLAAGVVTGLIGAAVGIPLVAVGKRELRRAHAGGERPSFRIAPGLAAVSLTGRF